MEQKLAKELDSHRQMLLSSLNQVDQIAKTSKWQRFTFRPVQYLTAILHRELVYPFTKKPLTVNCQSFFGQTMRIHLPSSTDIYLSGGKTHDSEIRLSRYLVKALAHDSNFLDVGAHYGYYSLLASSIIQSGKIIAVEASPNSFHILHQNTVNQDNVLALNIVVSNKNEQVVFYQFPNRFAEYNALDISQYENQKWFIQNQPTKVSLESKTIDTVVLENNFKPDVIKIDVEGAEFQAISGFNNYLSSHNPTLILEFLSAERDNTSHKKALDVLTSLGFRAHYITVDGQLELLTSIEDYFIQQGIDSDNFIFKKAY